jgi:hypothetical protein
VTWKTVKKEELKLSAVIEEYLQHHDGPQPLTENGPVVRGHHWRAKRLPGR